MRRGKRLSVHLFLVLTLFTAVFGAGIADVLWTDVIPIRPYTGLLITDQVNILRQSSVIGSAIEITLILLVVSTLLVAIANRTTGIVISHSGFTPNPNLTSSPGASSLLQIYPLFFAIFGLLAAYEVMKRHDKGGF